VGIKLSFEITSPLGPDDKDLLTGVSIMTLAIANHELAKEKFPEAFSDAEEAMEEQPCSAKDPDDPSRICVSKVAHMGRHKYRPLVGSSGLN
jgi:hypothetical protein